MVRRAESFFLFDFISSTLGYDINAIAAQGDMIPGPPGGPSSRPLGRSWWVFNTLGEANYTAQLDAQSTWFVNFWFRPLIFATGAQPARWIACEFFRILDATGLLFSITQTNAGRLELRRGDGLLLFTTGVYTVGVWHALQLKVIFDTAGAWELRVDGVTLGSDSGVNLGTRKPDRMMHRWNGSAGFNLAHYVVNDGQGSRNNDFLPYPWFVTAVGPSLDLPPAQWTASGGNTRAFDVGDTQSNAYVEYPDGNRTYIAPGAPDALALFRMASSPCYGRVLAVAASACASLLAPDQKLDLVVREKATVHKIGNTIALRPWTVTMDPRAELANYRIYQQVSEFSQETGAGWLDGDIDRAGWGVRAVTVDQRVTQFFLEKVTTADPGVSYKCGKLGSYAF